MSHDTGAMHSWIFVYHEYTRWFSKIATGFVRADSFPLIEGWYAAFIIPLGRPQSYTGIHGKVLPVTLNYTDGTSQYAYVTRSGELITVFQLSSPRHGVHLTGNTTVPCEMRTIPTSRVMSLNDIESGCRGNVLSAEGRRENGGRKISHIVSADKLSYLCQMYRVTFHDNAREDRIRREVVARYTPSLIEEFEKRMEPRFTKTEVIACTPYLESLFNK